MAESVNPKVGVLARPGQVDVRISARADSPEAARGLIAPTEARVRAALGDHVFAVDAETLESAVAVALARRGWRVASYEDGTGGAVAAALHEAAADRFLEGHVVTNAAARGRLAGAGGEAAVVAAGGGEAAGGDAVAAALARAVLRVSGADVALAVHSRDETAAGGGEEMAGAATAQNLGPGNTWLAVAGAAGEFSHHLGIGARGQVDRRRAAVAALNLLHRALR